jgi:hypothetical protein
MPAHFRTTQISQTARNKRLSILETTLYLIQNHSLPNPEYTVQEVVSKLRLSRINISSDYEKTLKSPKMLPAWAPNVGFAPTHSEK